MVIPELFTGSTKIGIKVDNLSKKWRYLDERQTSNDETFQHPMSSLSIRRGCMFVNTQYRWHHVIFVSPGSVQDRKSGGVEGKERKLM